MCVCMCVCIDGVIMFIERMSARAVCLCSVCGLNDAGVHCIYSNVC